MKLSKLFETKWGWAARGDEPPPKKPKPEISPEDKEKRREEKRELEIKRAWAPDRDVADELLKKQAVANAANSARKRPKKFFPES